ncbi:MAG TPA: tRNA lysidine(34) synthetase TilS, partial [candidate division Zixibacteria bacterium]|nr:tRNA lysidine(34) synthetase TilS [candidate division Zixibacteria bacterium]
NLNGSAIAGSLVVRSARAGDRFAPLGLHGSKSLGDFFTDNKVPRPLRGEVPLVCDERGIIWVAGYQIADRVKLPPRPTAATRPLELEIVQQRKASRTID